MANKKFSIEKINLQALPTESVVWFLTTIRQAKISPKAQPVGKNENLTIEWFKEYVAKNKVNLANVLNDFGYYIAIEKDAEKKAKAQNFVCEYFEFYEKIPTTENIFAQKQYCALAVLPMPVNYIESVQQTMQQIRDGVDIYAHKKPYTCVPFTYDDGVCKE